MAINPRQLEAIDLDLETARGQVASALLDPTVSADSKLIASAIVQAGAAIARATVEAAQDARRIAGLIAAGGRHAARRADGAMEARP